MNNGLPDFVLTTPLQLVSAVPIEDNLFKVIIQGAESIFSGYGTFENMQDVLSRYGEGKLFDVSIYLTEREKEPELETNVISFEGYIRNKKNVFDQTNSD